MVAFIIILQCTIKLSEIDLLSCFVPFFCFLLPFVFFFFFFFGGGGWGGGGGQDVKI